MSILLKRIIKALLCDKHLNLNPILVATLKKEPCVATTNMNTPKRLAAFDFDNTIIVENSDTIVRNLLPKDSVPKYVKNGWTKYMRSIFDLLHSNGVQESSIDKAVSEIAPINGMCELIKELSDNLNFDIIIISDANSYFINSWLKAHKLENNIRKVFTNPAEFTDGLLKIEMYHDQDWCTLSERNLCKGHILDEYIKTRKSIGVDYSCIAYIGDGSNDFCPVLRLKQGDLAFCRVGFGCAKLVRDARDGKPIENQLYEVKAGVHLWTTGFDVLNAIKNVIYVDKPTK